MEPLTGFCPRFPMCAIARVGAGRVLFTRLRCGQWSCEWCAKKNAEIWRAHLLDRLPDISDYWYLITLTAHERRRSAALSLANIRENLDRLFKRLRRIFKHFTYVRVYEKHPTSQARHAHLLCCGLSPFLAREATKTGSYQFVPLLDRKAHRGTWSLKTFFKRATRELGMGYQVDVSYCAEVVRGVGYVVKYLTKAQQDLNEKGLRHVQTSRNIGAPKVKSALSWKVASFFTAKDFAAGETITDLQTGEVLEVDYWSEQDVYPPEMI